MLTNKERTGSLLEMDLTGVRCPINFAKIMVRLSKLEIGEQLLVVLDDEESTKNVPTSLDMEGHKIISLKELDNKKFQMVVEKRK